MRRGGRPPRPRERRPRAGDPGALRDHLRRPRAGRSRPRRRGGGVQRGDRRDAGPAVLAVAGDGVPGAAAPAGCPVGRGRAARATGQGAGRRGRRGDGPPGLHGPDGPDRPPPREGRRGAPRGDVPSRLGPLRDDLRLRRAVLRRVREERCRRRARPCSRPTAATASRAPRTMRSPATCSASWRGWSTASMQTPTPLRSTTVCCPRRAGSSCRAGPSPPTARPTPTSACSPRCWSGSTTRRRTSTAPASCSRRCGRRGSTCSSSRRERTWRGPAAMPTSPSSSWSRACPRGCDRGPQRARTSSSGSGAGCQARRVVEPVFLNAGLEDRAPPARRGLRQRFRAAVDERAQSVMSRWIVAADDEKLEDRFGSTRAQRRIFEGMLRGYRPELRYGFVGEIAFELSRQGAAGGLPDVDHWTLTVGGVRADTSPGPAGGPCGGVPLSAVAPAEDDGGPG